MHYEHEKDVLFVYGMFNGRLASSTGLSEWEVNESVGCRDMGFAQGNPRLLCFRKQVSRRNRFEYWAKTSAGESLLLYNRRGSAHAGLCGWRGTVCSWLPSVLPSPINTVCTPWGHQSLHLRQQINAHRLGTVSHSHAHKGESDPATFRKRCVVGQHQGILGEGHQESSANGEEVCFKMFPGVLEASGKLLFPTRGVGVTTRLSCRSEQ